MTGKCESCEVQRTLLVRRLAIYAAVGFGAWWIWRKVR